MKKIILTVLFLNSLVWAFQAPNDSVYDYLFLSKNQKTKINEIELKTEKERKNIVSKYNFKRTNEQTKEFYKELKTLSDKKDSEILKLLNPVQKQKYKEYYSRVY